MARFPRKEAQITALARQVAGGLRAERDDFPAPPVPPDELLAKLAEFEEARQAAVQLEAALTEQHVVKDRALRELVDAVKVNLRYAEIAARNQPVKLGALGWGHRRDRTPLEKPGQPLNIAIKKEGDTWLTLAWDAPVDGGKVATYVVKRRRGAGSRWMTVANAMEREHTLTEQPRGEQLEFVVVGQNRAGEGWPSGTVTAVL